ncbi:MAG: heme exporter protein CcmB [Chloroflexi bacterium]|nr:heme exporter protein CcmB [Chloroflexota bacterium]
MSFAAKVYAIVRKDLLIELRSREVIASMFVFALIVILLFSFSFELRADRMAAVAPGALWVAFTFSGMLGLGRSFIRERDQGCLDGLLLSPVDRSGIFLGKMLANMAFISLIEATTLPLFLALFNLPFRLLLLPVIVLGTLGFAAVGTLFSALTVHGRAREILLPVLLLPIAIPSLIAAVKLTGGIIDGQPWADIRQWLNLLIGFDVIFTTISYMAFDTAMAE